MGSTLVIVLLAFAEQSRADDAGEQKFRGKLIDRSLKVLPVHGAALDSVTLGKRSDLAIPSSTRTMHVRYPTPGMKAKSIPCSTFRPVRDGNARPRLHTPCTTSVDELFTDELMPQRPFKIALDRSYIKEEKTSYVLKDLSVYSSEGEKLLQIDSQSASLGPVKTKKFIFRDASGKGLFGIEQRALAATATFDFYLQGNKLFGTLSKEVAKIDQTSVGTYFVDTNPRYKFWYGRNVDHDIRIEGSFSKRQYTIMREDWKETPLAYVKSDFEFVKDAGSYGMEVAAGVDAAVMLACAIIIDGDNDKA
eukprot:gnl/TRDRNA2_/TRDRNA2_136894_c0_seq1.p1 gnl/TRDRNA2_/TRDRNA2_136894_c0~~gnl/TRDRNA2_/TRDRNA2_136894_c0_seq1.p1  ORF type:complete len:314 (-),score=56.30 gnl/TRDRNA2_/TRDRNA2_136894_c0_seq1:92-1009(-)